jgi:AraC-like DNA-binding protein
MDEVTLLRLLRARDAIHVRYSEPLQLAALAREAALSPFHFLRLFRDAFGETPHRYLTRVRIEKAKALLVSGEPVTEVCLDVGFSSLGSFSALFARRVGAPPTTFRRRVFHVPYGRERAFIPHCFVARFATQQF